MTIVSAPAGVQQLSGEWRGAPLMVRSSGGDLDWEGRPALGAFVSMAEPLARDLCLASNIYFAGRAGRSHDGSHGNWIMSDPR
jgi:hypothetical protein